ncbi:MAG TPA: leucine--tRNA ligase [Polyangia bacterium]|nr:leucine--tRNA ligase [Polyangia bacterium]
MPYDHSTVEPKWQARWREAGVHKTPTDPTRPKFYALDMFPYPSGSGLHVGHCEGYTATDVLTRWKRMQGFRVLHPMGWDAFGLPAENYAIKHGVHPRVTTEAAIANFKRQIDAVGFAYDWSREIDTTDPDYVKWTQWIFLKLYERGLAYEGVIPINWCPNDKTGLANEEVTQGRCERCGTPVVRKDMRQWLLRITRYADRLLADLDELDWPASTLAMQRNWIGRSEGAQVTFKSATPVPGLDIHVFTTRPDTLYGATYMVLSPEHPLVEVITNSPLTTAAQRAAIVAYQEEARRKSDLERTDLAKDKTGVFTGATATNPVNGKAIPIWIADYVLSTYGTGAIMAVPAHDERDFAFAKKFGIPIVQVVKPASGPAPDPEVAFTEDGVATNSGSLDGLPTAEAKRTITKDLEARGAGKGAVSYRLRDWVFSRQRYWGEPIPLIHCPTDGVVPVPEAQLPVRLPNVESYAPTGTGESPLAGIESFVNTTCPTCGGPAKRETNTMPQWAGSCWYYLRYLDPENDAQIFNPKAEKEWMSVDLYVGGAEHAVLHLLYARFWHKVLFDMGLVHTKEPFQKLRHQGTVLAYSYQDSLGRYHEPGEIEFRGETPVLKATGETLTATVEKMAKSKLNGVNPDDVIRDYGADVMRLYEMFMGEFELPKPWDPRAIEGVNRFQKRVWRLIEEHDPAREPAGDPHLRLRHKTIKRVTADLERMQFNTAIAGLMEYVNALTSEGATRDDLLALVLLVGPFAPHLGDEAWERLRSDAAPDYLIDARWPTFDDALTIDERVTIGVQVDGKLRGSVELARDASEDDARAAALAVSNVSKHLEGRALKKFIYKPGRIIGLVTGPA